MPRFVFLIILVSQLSGCTEIPEKKFYQFYTNARIYFKNDTIYFSLNNPLKSPLRYYITSSDSILRDHLNDFHPLTLQAKKDTVLKMAGDSSAIKNITFSTFFGDLNRKIEMTSISLPFPEGKKYKINQGYNGSYSHNLDDFSRCALDIYLREGDTVCSADDGLVVGVIKDYKTGGANIKLKDFANVITLYHPQSGLFSQYVHLAYKSSFVKLGDTVKQGQPIGLAGQTGWTNGEHLHFNVLVPVNTIDRFKSVGVTFSEGYVGKNLRKNDWVKKTLKH